MIAKGFRRIRSAIFRPRASIIATALFGAACSSSGGDPATAVQDYLNAKVAVDADGIRRLLCSMMEASLEQELATFDGVQDPRIQDMSCSRVGDTDVVNCSGQIVATYGQEETEIPLTSYRVVEEDGEWKWCGKAE